MGILGRNTYGHHLFDEMRHHLSRGDSATTGRTRQLHCLMLTSGLFATNPQLTTRLLSIYASDDLSFSSSDTALAVLDSVVEPDLFSFSALIHAFSRLARFTHALSTFSRMVSRGVFPDSFVFPSVVKSCSGLRSLETGKQVHGFAFTFGFRSDSFVQSSLLHMYVKCGRIDDARNVFDKFPQRDFVNWSALISGYASHGRPKEANELFFEMRRIGLEPNTVTWNGMISGFNRSGLCSEAMNAFRKMHFEGFSSDSCSVSSVLPSVRDMGCLEIGTQVHCHSLKRGFGSDKCVVSAVIDMYGRFSREEEMSRAFREVHPKDVGALNAYVTGLSRNGFFERALEAFREFRGRGGMELNTVSWTSMIASCSQNGRDIEALELFREMQIEGVKPNSVTIPCLLPACGNVAALTHGRAAHCFSLRMGISDDVFVGSALIDMYANCGKIALSRVCFDTMASRNLVCWNAIMSGYAMHGKAKETIELFIRMQKSGQKPDFISFTCVLFACSQNGLTEKGQYYFNAMSEEHSMEPRLQHYGCMVTLLSRAGKLDEAYSMIREMPMEPDASIWGSLLSSCRLRNDVGLGEVAAKKLFELEPRNPGNYVILSNIYASKGMWGEVNAVRDAMHRMGVRKNPGCSWIEVRRQVHVLLAGDKSHPQMDEMMEKLRELGVEMKKSGHYPEVDFVLQDVEEHDKEQILCGHSEKLAVVFGLLNTPVGSSLRVIKNLRICGDCHAFIKFVSGFEAREVLVRDTNRFHHFKGGDCSCGDYW